MVGPVISKLFRRKKRQTLCIISVVIVVFCFMQFLSVMKLNVFQQNESGNHGDTLDHGVKQITRSPEIMDKQTLSHMNQSVQNDNIKVIPHGVHKDDAKLLPRGVHKDDAKLLPRGIHEDGAKLLPRGVHEDDAQKYKSREGNTFRCIYTGSEISMDMVNDDFCDCEDSSDEPGTSACPNSRFYCTYQIQHEDPQFIPGSQVNDGICDCCDGSDEWNRRVVPQHMHLSDELQKRLVYQSPCSDHCKQVLINIGQEEQMRRHGAQLRKTYIEFAQKLPQSNKQRYGPDGVFYKLAAQCFEYNTKEYQYTVCPFTSVKQQKPPGPSVSLGRNPSWEKLKPGDYVLQMLDGDAKLCSLGFPRKTKIHFLCGLEDRVMELSEKERCSYTVKFSSPAACA